MADQAQKRTYAPLQQLTRVESEITNVGKHFKSSKKRFRWTFNFNSKAYDIILFSSKYSGRRTLIINGNKEIETYKPSCVLENVYNFILDNCNFQIYEYHYSRFDIKYDKAIYDNSPSNWDSADLYSKELERSSFASTGQGRLSSSEIEIEGQNQVNEYRPAAKKTNAELHEAFYKNNCGPRKYLKEEINDYGQFSTYAKTETTWDEYNSQWEVKATTYNKNHSTFGAKKLQPSSSVKTIDLLGLSENNETPTDIFFPLSTRSSISHYSTARRSTNPFDDDYINDDNFFSKEWATPKSSHNYYK
ncbi:unnamed protein product [Blepharisma stoltei]|uniref:Uncharacterized protein n=1 Tax=Blepharisma stoltei TaxID=1481888 RepID=A0AAU9IRH5_9CILI|nr:unnamed protein product [Blepharisma stoltei]